MAVHTVLTEPHPILHKISQPVDVFDAGIKKLLDELLETMYVYDGIGLAAPQVGILKRILVMDLGVVKTKKRYEGGAIAASGPLKVINPEIVWVSDFDQSCAEGCLSVPNHYVDVERPAEVRVRYQDENGASQELFADGLLAICLQHEIDHLDGITLLDHEKAQKKHAALRDLLKP